MTAIEFLKKHINNIGADIIKALYEYHPDSGTHYIEIIPHEIVDNGEYDSELSNLIVEFENEFNGEMLCILGENKLTKLINPVDLFQKAKVESNWVWNEINAKGIFANYGIKGAFAPNKTIGPFYGNSNSPGVFLSLDTTYSLVIPNIVLNMNLNQLSYDVDAECSFNIAESMVSYEDKSVNPIQGFISTVIQEISTNEKAESFSIKEEIIAKAA